MSNTFRIFGNLVTKQLWTIEQISFSVTIYLEDDPSYERGQQLLHLYFHSPLPAPILLKTVFVSHNGSNNKTKSRGSVIFVWTPENAERARLQEVLCYTLRHCIKIT
ncbi:hypothetical protein NPIL_565521 [Nephila pilipes]|uniref:Uncharacterized protein n=1 Tax=Nephila pilipes TaxID=299642 RepID=A0A8X6NKA7_NEPPI|nr:hypothetical protein NPIL_565521 [Nephila pilipes]